MTQAIERRLRRLETVRRGPGPAAIIYGPDQAACVRLRDELQAAGRITGERPVLCVHSPALAPRALVGGLAS